MSKNIEIKMASDNGEQFYTRAHVDGLDGFEEYYTDTLELRNSLSDFQANHIQDSGWLDYQVGTGYKNVMYSSDGFNCGIRQIQYLYGNPDTGIKYVTQKMIRVNIRNFTDGQQIAQIPTNFTKYAQVFYSRSGSGKQPIMVELRASGAVNVYIDSADQSGDAFSNWIYAQFEWTE